MQFSHSEEALLKNYIATLEKENQAKNKERFLLLEQIARLQKQNNELRKRQFDPSLMKKYTNLLSENEVLQRQIQSLKLSLSENQQQIIYFREQYETVVNQSTFLYERIQTISKESFWYKEQYETVVKEIIYVKEQQETTLQQQINKHQSVELETLKHTLNDKNNEINRLTTLINHLKIEKDNSIKQMEQKNFNSINLMKIQIQNQIKVKQNYELLKIKELQDKKKIISQLEAEREKQTLQQRLREQQYKIDELQIKIKAYKEANEKLINQNQSFESHYKSHQQTTKAQNFKRITGLQQTNCYLESILKEKDNELGYLKQLILEKQNAIESIYKEKQFLFNKVQADKETKIDEILKEKEYKTEQKLRQKQSRILLLQKQLYTLEKALSQFKDQRELMEKALRQRSQEINFLESKSQNNNHNDIELLFRQISDLKNYQNSLLKQKTNLTVHNLKLEEKLKQTQQQSLEALKYRELYIREAQMNKNSLQHLRIENTKLTHQKIQLQAQLKEMRELKAQNMQNRNSGLKQAINSLTHEVRDLKKNNSITVSGCKDCQFMSLHSAQSINQYSYKNNDQPNLYRDTCKLRKSNVYKSTKEFQNYIKTKPIISSSFRKLPNKPNLYEKMALLKSQNEDLKASLY